MAQNDIISSNLATFNRPSINGMVAAAKTNKLTLDKFSNYYQLEESVILGFPMLKKYDNILRSSLIDLELPKERYYRPEYLSYDLYGTTDLWYLLMYLNNFYRVEDFVGPAIKIPAYDPLQVLNTIINDEGGITHTPRSPLPVRKSYLKHPSFKSDTITKTLKEETIPWTRGTTIQSNNSYPWDGTFYQRSFYLASNTVKDANGNSVRAITLDGSGTTSVPSIYFKDGYRKTLKGRIYLDSSKYYSLFKLLNGTAEYRLSKEGTEVAYEKFSNYFGETTLIADSRSANIESTTGDSSLYSSVVNFDNINGVYKFRSLVSSMKESLMNDGICLAKTTFKNSEKDRLNVDRLNGASYIMANVIYSFNDTGLTFVDKVDHQIVVTYSDGSTSTSPTSTPKFSVVDTQGYRAVLKVAVKNSPGKTISKVDVKTLFKLKSVPEDSFNLEYNLFGVHLFRIDDTGNMTVPYKPTKTGWYDFSIDYSYTTEDENGYDLFPDEFYHGIYFNPKFVVATTSSTADHSFSPKINDGGNTAPPSIITVTKPTATATSPNNTRDVRIYSGSLQFPDEFMMTIKLDHTSLSTGGGVGFVFNYDKATEQGYMLWISSTGSNSALPAFAQDGGQNILRTGFYELDSVEGTPYPVFSGDELTTISVRNYRPLEINGRYLKIIRHLNRIRIYPSDASGTLTSSTTPLLDLQDVSNYHVGGGWELLGVYATGTLTISNYETWKTTSLIDKGTDW